MNCGAISIRNGSGSGGIARPAVEHGSGAQAGKVSDTVEMTRRLFVLALVVLTVAGCDGPFSPYWDGGTYDLRHANNRHIPAVVSEGPPGSVTEVVGGSLTLRRDHSYRLLVDVREVSAGRV